MSAILHTATPKARKEHRCDLCTGTIIPGETYRRDRCVWDDGPYVFKQCSACLDDAIMDKVWDWLGGPDDGVNEDSAIDWARQAGTPEAARLIGRAVGVQG